MAEQEQIVPEKTVSEAEESGVNRRELEGLLAFGKRHSAERGLTPDDVADAISAIRSTHLKRPQ